MTGRRKSLFVSVWSGTFTVNRQLDQLSAACLTSSRPGSTSTSGLALLLASTPHQFTGLITIGRILFMFNLAIFLATVAGITMRFVMDPGTLQKSLMHPTEALSSSTAILSGKVTRIDEACCAKLSC